MSNLYCQVTGIDIPSLDAIKGHRKAGTFALMVVALLEEGGPLTLDQIADRFARADIASREKALVSLKRCRPARAPVYRDGNHFALDPHDDGLDMWIFRLELRPPRMPRLKIVRTDPTPLPGNDVPLTPGELQEAFHLQNVRGWSAQRLALAVLDAHGPRLNPGDVNETLDGLTDNHGFRLMTTLYWRSGAVRVDEDGFWILDPDHKALPAARKAVRDRVMRVRRQKESGADPVVVRANIKAAERARSERAKDMARLRRVLVHAFPGQSSKGVVLLDINRRTVDTFLEHDMPSVRERLAEYDYIAGLDIRQILREVGFDPQMRRLGELGPSQKTVKLNRRGRTLKITTELLIQGSCGISNPLGDPRKIRGYLKRGELGRYRRRLEANAKSLFALYSYGMLHHAVRLNWGFLDMRIRAPWVHTDEPHLHGILREAFEEGRDLEVVSGSAPGWKEPWSRARRCEVFGLENRYGFLLVDEDGRAVFHDEVQLVRSWGDR